jgi:hypothetical protein
LNDNLKPPEKMLLAEIHTLQKKAGCFAFNAHFSSRLGVKERQVRNLLSSLIERGHLRVANPASNRRRLWVDQGFPEVCVSTPGPLLNEQRAYLTLLREKVRSALASGGKISDNERERVVSDLRQSFPHYGGAAALPPDELIRASIGWVAAQMQK